MRKTTAKHFVGHSACVGHLLGPNTPGARRADAAPRVRTDAYRKGAA